MTAMVKTILFIVGYVQNGAVWDSGLEHNNLTHRNCFQSIQGLFCFIFVCLVVLVFVLVC